MCVWCRETMINYNNTHNDCNNNNVTELRVVNVLHFMLMSFEDM